MENYLTHQEKLQIFNRDEPITHDKFGDMMKIIDKRAIETSREYTKYTKRIGIKNLPSSLNSTLLTFINDFVNRLSLDGLPYDSTNFGRLVQTVQRELIYVTKEIEPNTSYKEAKDLFDSSLERLLTDFISSDGTEWIVSFSERFYSWAHIRFIHGVINEIVYKQTKAIGVSLLYQTMLPYLSSVMVRLSDSRPPRTQREKDQNSFGLAYGVPSGIGPDNYARSPDSTSKLQGGKAKPERIPTTSQWKGH